jgi:hypothetical protein
MRRRYAEKQGRWVSHAFVQPAEFFRERGMEAEMLQEYSKEYPDPDLEMHLGRLPEQPSTLPENL